MRVKCRVDGELPFGRKEQMVLAVHGPHPAAKRIEGWAGNLPGVPVISFVVREVCKGGNLL